MKNLFLAMTIVSIPVFSGCSTKPEGVNPPSSQIRNDIEQYSSKLLSLEFPKTYSAQEDGNMLIISGVNGKIIIGGFTPSVGHPDPEEKDFPFQMITYSADPKMEHNNAIPAALYYQHEDQSTKEELLTILKTVKKLP